MDDIYLNKLPSDSGTFLILTKWEAEYIDFNIHEIISNKTFKGELSLQEMEEIAKELEIIFADFREECRNALTTHHGLPQFKYDINREQKKFLLTKKDTFTIIQYLDIKLIEDNNVSSKMLETAVDFISVQNAKALEMLELKSRAQKSYQEICNAYEMCLEEKNNIESKLLKKFTLLLNSKKDKIAELLIPREDKEDFDDSVEEILNTEPSTSSRASVNQINETTKKAVSSGLNRVSDDDIFNDEEEFLACTELMTQPVKKRRKTNEENDITKEVANEGEQDSNYESI